MVYDWQHMTVICNLTHLYQVVSLRTTLYFSALSFVCLKLDLLQIFYAAENHDCCLLKEGKYEPELQDANVPEQAIVKHIFTTTTHRAILTAHC